LMKLTGFKGLLLMSASSLMRSKMTYATCTQMAEQQDQSWPSLQLAVVATLRLTATNMFRRQRAAIITKL
jgi:ABC-type uncharacterized transport system involved in gliding motility auxiliary subunit